MTEVEQQPQTNGIETIVEDENSKVRPADIEAVRVNKKQFTLKFVNIVTLWMC